MSSRRPWPIHWTSPLPQSFSPRTLMRLSTRSRTAWASSEASLSVVKDVHSGLLPGSSVLRYEIRYLGIEESRSLLQIARSLHHVREPMKEVVRVVGAGRRFRVVLHGERRPLPVTQALARAVVEVDVSRFPALTLDGGGVDSEAVVLRGDLHAAGGRV